MMLQLPALAERGWASLPRNPSLSNRISSLNHRQGGLTSENFDPYLVHYSNFQNSIRGFFSWPQDKPKRKDLIGARQELRIPWCNAKQYSLLLCVLACFNKRTLLWPFAHDHLLITVIGDFVASPNPALQNWSTDNTIFKDQVHVYITTKARDDCGK